ncbi:hypothetical protein BFG05_03290 [Campylobacter pinnipediorum subsp. pinnipediorum]|uniref:hypothetical protein n=1 Tax=Campylobacter pinnipediorum TaxID=1965231 RepID=UPI0009CF23D3|nr:hypothetical protein [Campylobacter pinnipediorum]OPA78247.1 hypothetical protein BFG05_03290 [Campylobacter pinnipediorum subsp. pinnipediorum]
MKELLKDDKLFEIIKSNYGNIAQFISISPKNIEKPKLVVINNLNSYESLNIKSLIMKLIDSSRSGMVNIRSFSKVSAKGHKLHYGKEKKDIEEILQIIKANASNNMYSIINENIDIKDGGVSGVVLGNIIEFSPDDTPKCVEKDGICKFGKELGYMLLKKVYGFVPNINFTKDYRVEFSIHPNKEGVNKEHTILWEYEKFENYNYNEKISWPNNFSKFLGDKVFGLLIADCLGFNIPYTTVISRRVAPFTFGKHTGSSEKWFRTCPLVKEPGKYITKDSWLDPFDTIASEEKKGNQKMNLASVISQESVEAKFSGASIVSKNFKDDIIEGVIGKGDSFMVGLEPSQKLPKNILNKILEVHNKLRSHMDILGNKLSIEWVCDGKKVWVVQLNQLKNDSTITSQHTIVDKHASSFIKFNTDEGLDALRLLINEIKNTDVGIELVGNIGITSHFGDILRQNNISSYISN